MQLTRLALTDFRNYQHTVWKPEQNISVLTGENGSGKTNLLEAVSLLGPGRGLRNASLPSLCRTEATHWGIAATLRRNQDETTIGTGANLSEHKRRTFRIDGMAARSQTEIAKIFSSVWLTPQMDKLFLEGTSGRRRFLDRLVVALFPEHARQITAHERSVSSRNRILQTHREEGEWLNAVEDSIARHAVAASATRLLFIERMNATTPENTDFPRSHLTLDCPIAHQLTDKPALNVEDTLRKHLKECRQQDTRKGTTSIGAHRADFLMSDHATGRTAALSSSGQQKALLLGIILAHASLIERIRGEAPVLLLDEPLLHLDEHRRNALLNSLRHLKTPVLLTGTDPEPFAALNEKAGFFHVKNGTITPD